MRRTVPIRPLRGLAALGAALLLGLGAASDATASTAPALRPADSPMSQQQTFGIQPATASGPDSRSAYSYSATTGAQVKDHVAVWNYGDQPLSLTLYAADAFNTDAGGYDVLPAGKASSDVGAWVHLATETVKLPGRSRQIVPFTLAVPANATPGDHSGGIVLALRRQTVDAKGNAVAVDQRVGARIHVRIAGALRPALTVEAVHTVYHGTLNPFGTGSTTTSYTVRNTGNIRLGGRQAVRVRNVLGSVVTANGPAALTELLPGNTATYTVAVGGIFPTLWSTASVTIDPLAVPGDVDPALPSATSSVSYATIPWTLLAVLLPLLALAFLTWRSRRRRRGAAGPTGGTWGGGTPPQAPTAPGTATDGAASPEATGAAAPPVSPVAGVPVPVPPKGPRVPVPVAATGGPAAVPVPGVGGAVPVPATGEAAKVKETQAAQEPLPAAAHMPVGTVEPARTAETEAGAAATTVAAAGGGTAAVTATLVLGGLLLSGGLAAANAPRAYADPTSPASSGSPAAGGATGTGTIAFDYLTGHEDDPIDVLTSGPCPHAGDFVAAGITGAGFPTAGASVVGLSPASIFPLAANGGYVVPLSNSLRAIARQNGISALRGRYVVKVYCKGRFLPAHFKDFTGALTFGADGAWHAEGTAATVLVHGDSATPAPQRPAPALPSTTTTSAAGPKSDGGMRSDSVAALVGGGGLLALLGGSYLRRRREKVKAIQAATAGSAKAATARTASVNGASVKEKAAKR